jgi:carbamoyl-phosphate synthase large subunit
VPLRKDIRKVFLIGSGPIVIGQACEFDYAGTQAIKALRSEGIEVVLLNSNPATVMTDVDLATRTYIEPMTVEICEQIIEREKPDALLPTMGGQTALNLAKQLSERGILAKHGVRMIGASLAAINKAEDRQLFKEAMARIGLPTPKSLVVHTLEAALAVIDDIGLPAIIRPSFTLAGTGGGIAQNRDEYLSICRAGLAASPISTVLVEESVLGWKEFELEVVRDSDDNVVIVCSIENLDPMGIHTGDSVTVAPAQTLTDREYQQLRNAAIAVVREIGVDTGGANVQFGVNPVDGRMVVIEMNPRVSRSSALASKATGYPIAKIATKLAIGYTLGELKNDITQDTTASFEPTLDYVVVKIPRFDFEKFPSATTELNTTMHSVGEVMALGATFSAAYMKAMRSLDVGALALHGPPAELSARRADRLYAVAQAFRRGVSLSDIYKTTSIDRFFLGHIQGLVQLEFELAHHAQIQAIPDPLFRHAKRSGFSDKDIAHALQTTEACVREERWRRGLRPVYRRVDTCAGEFPAHTPYFYSVYEEEDEVMVSKRSSIMILGSGPIRIGQGVEFDYTCVHAALALEDAGFETIMVNCNPETVSTDVDTAGRLYFEPVTLEDVLEIVHREEPLGVLVQFGGQTPLRIAKALTDAGVAILGTSADAIDRAENRERFAEVLTKLTIRQPQNGVARTHAEALSVAEKLGYPVMVRPSYVLGGRSMEVVQNASALSRYIDAALSAGGEHPVLIDRFLSRAVEVDIDIVRDGTGHVIVGGLLEHVEEAGVHSGDAASVLPPHSLSVEIQERIIDAATAIAHELGVVGLMNAQFAVQGSEVYVLEVNPRASRTVPFVAKATGIPLAKLAARAMAGLSLPHAAGRPARVQGKDVFAVKESVFPFSRFAGSDVQLGPEMRSTGEVMGLALDPYAAFGKGQEAANTLPSAGAAVLFAIRAADGPLALEPARRLARLGSPVHVTSEAFEYLCDKGVACHLASDEAGVTLLAEGLATILVSTDDNVELRKLALRKGYFYATTMQAALMLARALEERAAGAFPLIALQDLETSQPVERAI